MKKFTITLNGKHYTRITKTEAHRRYNSFEPIAIHGIHQNTRDYFFTIQFSRDADSFISVLNAWKYYNEAYYGYPCFYKIED